MAFQSLTKLAYNDFSGIQNTFNFGHEDLNTFTLQHLTVQKINAFPVLYQNRKKCIKIQVFQMYFYSQNQKLNIFRIPEKSLSANLSSVSKK